jgi:two-component system, NtrC family, sensor kinase
MNFGRLRIRLILAFMLVSLVPLASLGYKLISQGETLITERASSYLTGLSRQNAEAVTAFMLERVNDLDSISAVVCRLAPDPGVLSALLAQMTDRFAPYLGFVGLDHSGNQQMAVWKHPPDAGIPASLPAGETVWMGAEFTNVFSCHLEGLTLPALMICKPLTPVPGDHCARLCSVIDFRVVDELLRKSNIEDTGEVYLVDHKGLFLSSSRFGARALRDVIPMDLPGKTAHGLHQITDYRGETVLQAYHKVGDFPWYVMADQDMAEIVNRIRHLGREALVYGLLTALAVFALALFVSTVIVNILKAKYQYEKELEFQVIQKEKLASLGLLTSGLAHELNTPLANALLYTQIAKEELGETGSDAVHQQLATVIDEVRRGGRIVRNLLDYSRHSRKDDSGADVNGIITKLMEITRPHCAARNISVHMHLAPDIPCVAADASTFQAILTNLIANAIEAMPGGGVMSLKTRYLPAVKKVKIEVADTGPGISQADLSRIFDPFFTTKKPGDGTGLGLFVSYEMARKLGGDIKVVTATKTETERSGTIFFFELPAQSA